MKFPKVAGVEHVFKGLNPSQAMSLSQYFFLLYRRLYWKDYYIQLRIYPFYIPADQRIVRASQYHRVESVAVHEIIHVIFMVRSMMSFSDYPFFLSGIFECRARCLENIYAAVVSADALLVAQAVSVFAR